MNAEHTCFTCGVEIDAHGAYCDDCVAAQIAEQGGTDLEVFDAYHEWVDRLAERL